MSTDISIVEAAVLEARAAAAKATREFLANNGDRDMCGFAWITVYEKGNTKVGKALIAQGFRKGYGRGAGLELWNPSGNPTQSITAKEQGAEAATKVLSERLGVKAYAGSRLD